MQKIFTIMTVMALGVLISACQVKLVDEVVVPEVKTTGLFQAVDLMTGSVEGPVEDVVEVVLAEESDDFEVPIIFKDLDLEEGVKVYCKEEK